MIATFQPQHLHAATFLPEVAATLRPKIVDVISELWSANLVMTILSKSGEKILGVAAAVPVSYSRCEVLIVATHEQKLHPIEFVKGVQAVIKMCELRFDHIQALGNDTPEINRWLSWFGFVKGARAERPELEGEVHYLWHYTGHRRFT